MSVSQNFPDEGPSLVLNFAGAKKLDPRITFTRSSTGTYLDRSGLVVTAPANSPRFEHSYNGSNVESLGLLIEESRTNLVVQSETFNTGWSLAGATIGINSTTAPDGTSNADAALEDGTNGQHTVYRDVTTSPSSTYTASCFIKAGTRTYAEIFINGAGGAGSVTVAARYDLTNLTVVSTGNGTLVSSSIVAYPNGWYRCSMVGSVGGTGSIVRYHVRPSEAGTGDYQGINGAVGIYIWGAQLETGAFPTSYIPTVASTVTRSADNASMTGTNFSSWYNSTASTGGTISVQARRGYSGNFSGYPNLYEIGDGTNNNRIIVYGIVSSTEYTLNIQTSGVQQLDYVFDTISTTNLFKTINSFATNSSTLCVNGSLKTTDTSVTLPSADRLFIGCVNGFGNKWNGTISSLSYYPKALTNSQLQNLTK